MPKFSLRSKEQLTTCHPDIRAVCNELILYTDFSVTCGHRGKADQTKAYKEGKSKAMWPKSAHNSLPSKAVDLVPYPVDWEDIGRFQQLYGAFMVVAQQLRERGIIKSEFVWGGNWKSIKDFPHFEIKEKK